MDVSDMKVTDEDGFLPRSMMIKVKNFIMKERTLDQLCRSARLCFSLASRQWHSVTR